MNSNQEKTQNAVSRLIWFILAAAAVLGVLLGTNLRSAGIPITGRSFDAGMEIRRSGVAPRMPAAFKNTRTAEPDDVQRHSPRSLRLASTITRRAGG